jgi:hypothetical protein
MKKYLIVSVMVVAIATQGTVYSAVTEKEAEQLGKNLTLFGAEQAGNAAGTIPPYTGGLPPTTAVPGWVKGSGRYDRSPYDNEKPLFSITSANINKYAENLTEGQIALLKKYPDYRLNVYPSHRSVAWPDKMLSFCKKNAINAKLTESGDGVVGAHSCVPFPVPKNGLEVQWNTQLKPIGGHYIKLADSTSVIADGRGRSTFIAQYTMNVVNLYQNTAVDKLETPNFQRRMAFYSDPPSKAGDVIMLSVSSNFDKQKSSAWIYSPGQRRVRLAPEFSYDSLISQFDGELIWDSASGFQGRPDYFDWKLVGKKEVYIPYNNNRQAFAPLDKITAKKSFIDPDLSRWELHRVWVVEMTLKPGARHVDSRRTLYIDEDTWAIVAADGYDHAGKLYRAVFNPVFLIWDRQSYYVEENYYNLIKGSYVVVGSFNKPTSATLVDNNKKVNLNEFTAAAMESFGVR